MGDQQGNNPKNYSRQGQEEVDLNATDDDIVLTTELRRLNNVSLILCQIHPIWFVDCTEAAADLNNGQGMETRSCWVTHSGPLLGAISLVSKLF